MFVCVFSQMAKDFLEWFMDKILKYTFLLSLPRDCLCWHGSQLLISSCIHSHVSISLTLSNLSKSPCQKELSVLGQCPFPVQLCPACQLSMFCTSAVTAHTQFPLCAMYVSCHKVLHISLSLFYLIIHFKLLESVVL